MVEFPSHSYVNFNFKDRTGNYSKANRISIMFYLSLGFRQLKLRYVINFVQDVLILDWEGTQRNSSMATGRTTTIVLWWEQRQSLASGHFILGTTKLLLENEEMKRESSTINRHVCDAEQKKIILIKNLTTWGWYHWYLGYI